MKNLSVTSYVMNLENLPDSFEILRFTDDKKFAVIEERNNFKKLVSVEMLQEMLANNNLELKLKNLTTPEGQWDKLSEKEKKELSEFVLSLHDNSNEKKAWVLGWRGYL
jgi:hypothetical protein